MIACRMAPRSPPLLISRRAEEKAPEQTSVAMSEEKAHKQREGDSTGGRYGKVSPTSRVRGFKSLLASSHCPAYVYFLVDVQIHGD